MFVHRVRDEAVAEARRVRCQYSEDLKFLRSWAAKPLTTGAVSPSGRSLARAMAAVVDPAWDGTVVELGPGTGAVTTALLERGVAPERLLAVEYNPEFAEHIRARFPGLRVKVGDAYEFADTLRHAGVANVAAVVSSLPLFTQPPLRRRHLLEQAMSALEPGRPFIQFSYALVPPLPAEAGRWTLDVSGWIVRNLPPARVWTYRKA
ncbi:Phospholipid N-methyltransferase [uncultured Pleomorphomonas sp.]|uniref:Phospholipid N-methyltransferase n=1 Tax=uncultured Pleomorphomonas sp. TaxID=442121 RepID=A0A212LIL7_9HYPH|nr:methyltransferase domain-containing protein [Pleomorphomonas carboxyditropha]SCM77395.1 Phospholipid N-methyltransferase [uncultured Pleomorphomonas sp.]